MNTFEYLYLLIVTAFITLVCVVLVGVHSQKWVIAGYAGKNKILELREIERFIAHMITEISIVSIVLIALLSPLVENHIGFTVNPQYIWAIASFGMGAGVYAAFKRRDLGKNGATDTSDDI